MFAGRVFSVDSLFEALVLSIHSVYDFTDKSYKRLFLRVKRPKLLCSSKYLAVDCCFAYSNIYRYIINGN